MQTMNKVDVNKLLLLGELNNRLTQSKNNQTMKKGDVNFFFENLAIG